MPVSCSAPGCTKRYSKLSKEAGISFFRFPKDRERLHKWKISMKRTCLTDNKKLWEPGCHDRICSLHFLGGKPSTIPDHPDYGPSVFNFTPPQKTTPERFDRYERVCRRRLSLTPIQEEVFLQQETNPRAMELDQQDNEDMAASALIDLGTSLLKLQDAETDPEPDLLQKDNASIQQDHAFLQQDHASLQQDHAFLQQDHDFLQNDHAFLQKQYQQLLYKNDCLKQEIRVEKFSYTNLKNCHIKSFTGLPSYAVFIWVLGFFCTLFKKIGKLSAGDQLLLVLMKIRLNLSNQDLGYRFNICPTQVSKILVQCIPLLAHRLRFLIKWPSKATVLKNMPRSFRRNYKKCRVIIDCSEIFIQRPSNLDSRAKTWSNYKHHNTLKFLVGITPYGAISFLSECWGGRVSDKELTLKCGFYDKLEHGDLILADRGFLISEELAIQGAELAIPPFGRGKKQFCQKEVEMARRLSRSRIHVERAIERIKNFNILKYILPISLLRHADDILVICGAITNLLPKLVK